MKPKCREDWKPLASEFMQLARSSGMSSLETSKHLHTILNYSDIEEAKRYLQNLRDSYGR